MRKGKQERLNNIYIKPLQSLNGESIQKVDNMRAATQLQYRIGMVARLTGISVHTLRVWERRHQVVVPTRTEGGDRLYSAADVARLQRVSELIGAGHSVSRLAPLSDEELSRLAGKNPVNRVRLRQKEQRAREGQIRRDGSRVGEGERSALIERVIDAVQALDHRRAAQLLGHALIGLEPAAFVVEIIEPLLATVGERWRAGTLEIYHEHLLSNLVRDLLVSLTRNVVAASGARRLIIATPQGERHEFGALTVAIIAASHGWAPTYLGVDLPAADIVHAAQESGAELVLLSITYEHGPAIQEELLRIEQTLDDSTAILVGGAAAARLDLTRAELVDAARLTERLTTPA